MAPSKGPSKGGAFLCVLISIPNQFAQRLAVAPDYTSDGGDFTYAP